MAEESQDPAQVGPFGWDNWGRFTELKNPLKYKKVLTTKEKLTECKT